MGVIFCWARSRVRRILGIMRYATRQQRLRHKMIADWRGVADGPLNDSPVVSPATLIPKILQDWKLNDTLRLDEVAALWNELVGNFIAKQTSPDGLKRGVLTVRVIQPAIHHSLLSEKARLLRAMQERFGANIVRDLKFRHG